MESVYANLAARVAYLRRRRSMMRAVIRRRRESGKGWPSGKHELVYLRRYALACDELLEAIRVGHATHNAKRMRELHPPEY